tara:strand:- start:3649 stop:3846 length:198 start_codon:yes stop_codon:yes gene_type:complete
MDIEKAKKAYMEECNKLGTMPRFVSYMTYDQYSEQYTIGNTTDGDVADLQPNGFVLRMHWNVPKQ